MSARTTTHSGVLINAVDNKNLTKKVIHGMLDMIILRMISATPMHGYQIITTVRRTFGVYFGPSTIYPILSVLEERGFVKSAWRTDTERPRKVYVITAAGANIVNFQETTLQVLIRKMGIPQ